MRRLLTVTGFAVAAAGLIAAPASASQPLPKGAYYGTHAGTLHTILGHCPVAPPIGTTSTSNCAQLKGPFTVSAPGGKKLTGTYVANLATGDTDASGTGDCSFTHAVFTFTVGKGNTFKAATSPTVTSEPARTCLIPLGPSVGPHDRVALTTTFDLAILSGTGRFKGLTGTAFEDGAAVANVSPTGVNSSDGRIVGDFGMFFGAG
jgi:hypothetical protein